ncbi:MAG: PQQ-binding-like beta-propeller repeat protein, partial [Planctomycetaceae bacterium]
QWRGPSFNGVSGETNLPTEFGPDQNVAWKLPLPGPAGATPVIWEDRIFLTSVDGENLVLLCASTDGKELWRRTIGRGNKNVRGDEGNSASPSPVTDGKFVWSTMANGDIACFDFQGNEVWSMNLQDRFGKFDIAFGMSSTPVLHGDRLYFQFIHGDGRPSTQEALVACIDKRTSETIWRTDRITGASNENEHSYASPVLYDFDGLRLLITHGADYTIAYDLDSGKEAWRLGGLNPQNDPDRDYHPTLRFVASPGVGPGLVVAPTAKNGPVFAVRPNLKGDLTGNREAIVWIRESGTPDVPTPLVHGGLVYLCRENGNLIALDAGSGEPLYEERTHRQRHRASPIYADGKIYLTARDGRITVVKAGPEFEILAENELGEDISASPAISNGTIYLRTFESLWA